MQPVEPTNNVLPFPALSGRASNPGFSAASSAGESDPSLLVPLYAQAVAPCRLDDSDRRKFADLFRGASTLHRVAFRQMGSEAIGLALAAPVATIEDLAYGLYVDRIPVQTRKKIECGDAWMLATVVDRSVPRLGVGRELANWALARMRERGARHVFVAHRTADSSLCARLVDAGFSREAVTSDSRRVLLSRDTQFHF